MYDKELRYTTEHEWVRVAGDTATVGITDHAQDQLGDIVFVDLPKVGARIQSMQSFGTVESVKAVSDLYAPMSGEVVEINESLVDEPEKLNSDPHGAGWLVKVLVENQTELASLMSAEDYLAYIEAERESS